MTSRSDCEPLPKPTLSPFALARPGTSLRVGFFFTAAVWCVPALQVPLVHSLINHFRQNMEYELRCKCSVVLRDISGDCVERLQASEKPETEHTHSSQAEYTDGHTHQQLGMHHQQLGSSCTAHRRRPSSHPCLLAAGHTPPAAWPSRQASGRPGA